MLLGTQPSREFRTIAGQLVLVAAAPPSLPVVCYGCGVRSWWIVKWLRRRELCGLSRESSGRVTCVFRSKIFFLVDDVV